MGQTKQNAEPLPSVPNSPSKVFSEEKLRTFICRAIKTAYIPSSVYRMQFNHEFTFRDASALLPYLKDLGIEAVYCSPYFQAMPGSMHGYNVTNPKRINNEIGSIEDYEAFCLALKENGLSHIVDIVPNHMGIIGHHNPWWSDVLESGPSSLYAQYFDIDWKPIKQELWGKVLLPVLGGFYSRVLENQEIQLGFADGAFFVTYYENRFPIDPNTYPVILSDDLEALTHGLRNDKQAYHEYLSIVTAFQNLPPSSEESIEKKIERDREKEIAKSRLDVLVQRCPEVKNFISRRIDVFNGNKEDSKSFDRLDELLGLQSYRLSFWSVASQEINYRRFFDINELAAIRIEDENVFQEYHQFLFQLIKANKIQGLRIDHPDGLYDPPVYFRRLQREYLVQLIIQEEEKLALSENRDAAFIDFPALRETLERLLADEFSSSPIFYVVGEKILERTETLPENWNIHGTVGYDYLNALNGLFVDPQHDTAFADLYEHFIGHQIDFDELVYNKKKFIGLVPMASEINALGHRLDKISETNRQYRDFTRNDLTVAIREVIAAFPVYRTYVSPRSKHISERDEKYIRFAVMKAKKKTPALNPAVYDFLRDALLLRLNVGPQSNEARQYQDFLMRFQQQTGPVMAKGVEDTSFYVYNRLISLNEVGGDPFYFGYQIKDFHEHNSMQNERWPHTMLTTSTHDTKRSEDVRMRINVLSEIPEQWKSKINQWAQFNDPFKTMIEDVLEPRRNTEYFIYQTLLGVWPDEPLTEDKRAAFIERVWQSVLKSIREAKVYTNWTQPDAQYEDAVKRFIHRCLSQRESEPFWNSFLSFQRKVSFLGKLNSLSATLLKIVSPGVVDVYQGNDLWDYSLVDPDNRRQVDYDLRKSVLHSLRAVSIQDSFKRNIMSGMQQETMSTIKLLYTYRGLNFRRENKEFFSEAEYIPIEVVGSRGNLVVAFLRKHRKEYVLAVAGRFFTQWPLDKPAEELHNFWGGTELVWPQDLEVPQSLRDVLTAQTANIVVHEDKNVIKVSDLFQKTGAVLLTTIGETK